MSNGQRFFVAKTYVTDHDHPLGFSAWGWHVFVIRNDGSVHQLDDFHNTEEEALQAARFQIHDWVVNERFNK